MRNDAAANPCQCGVKGSDLYFDVARVWRVASQATSRINYYRNTIHSKHRLRLCASHSLEIHCDMGERWPGEKLLLLPERRLGLDVQRCASVPSVGRRSD